MKLILLVSFVLISSSLVAQSSDFMLFKKNDITIASYYAGNHISFTATDGAYVDGDILSIQNDTLFIRESVVRQVPTSLGVYMLDTTNNYYVTYNYKDIKSFGKTGRRFDLSGSDASLLGGGILITVASGVVYLSDKSQFSGELLIAGVVLGAAGYYLTKHNNSNMVIGKKYTIEYVSVVGVKKE